MVASLGYDARTCCAAARAGLVRPTPIESFRMPSPVDGEPVPAIGHAASLLTRGFEGNQRLLRLLQGLFTDLRTQGIVPHDGARVGFYCSFPDPLRTFSGSALIADEKARAALAEEAATMEGVHVDPRFAHRLVGRAAQLVQWRGTPTVRCAVSSGHAGGIEALGIAMREIEEQQVDVAVVLGVDSLLDEDTLAWLKKTQRLKAADSPVGLQPGEAAAAIVVEGMQGAGARQHRPIARISHVAFGSEPRSLVSGATPLGEQLAIALARVGEAAGWREGHTPWLIVDHNGEAYRATEWGHAVVRLRGDYAGVADATLWYPAASLGDTGSASSIVAMCMALAAIERRYRPRSSCVVTSTSDAHQRAVAVLAEA